MRVHISDTLCCSNSWIMKLPQKVARRPTGRCLRRSRCRPSRAFSWPMERKIIKWENLCIQRVSFLIQAFEVNVQMIKLFKRVTFLESRANCFSEVWISFGTTTHETHLIDMPGQLEYKQVEHNWAPTLLITILKFLFADTWQAFQHVTHLFHPISSLLYSKTVFLSF